MPYSETDITMQPARILNIHRDAEHLAGEAARRFEQIAIESVRRSGRFAVALSGGSTPATMFSRLANDPFRSAIPWESTLVFWADERCVPADHEDSNYRMAMYALLSKVPVPKENVYRIHGEIPSPDVAAREYSETVATAVAVTGSHNSHSLPNDLPRLDLVLLGLGEDGHTASLFPHSKALQSDRSIAAANYVETLGTYRITLTAAMINNARGVIFLVAGANKARALRNAFRCGYQPEAYPTQLIKPHNGLLLWMVDKASASLLVEEDPTLTDEFGNDQKTASDE